MPRELLDEKIHALMQEVFILEEMVRISMTSAVEAMKKGDKAAAKRVYDGDERINEKRFAIENACLIAIATQQPLAGDLRALASILEVITELERMGDYAKGIGKITILAAKDQLEPEHLAYISQMADVALDMLHKAISAFEQGDVRAAQNIPAQDDQVDFLYNQLYRTLIDYVITRPELFDQVNLLLWAAHNLERMGDRVTNICERTIFIATGNFRELDVDYDLKKLSSRI